MNSLSFEVAEGEVLGFLGPNGAGKTTTMRMLTGALGISSGRVTIDGHDVRTDSLAARRALGYLPESPPLYSEMRVGDYLDYAARLRQVPGVARADAVARALARTGLTAASGRIIGHLSKGFRQRVGIAQALVHEPRLLILDEPTSGLDPAQMAEIRALIDDLRGRHTILLSTHLLSEVTQSCDRVLIIAGGKKVAEGSESELRRALGAQGRLRLTVARPVEGITEQLLGLAGVASAEALGDGRYEVHAAEGQDPREAVNLLLQSFGLLESRSEGDLEELYLKAVSIR